MNQSKALATADEAACEEKVNQGIIDVINRVQAVIEFDLDGTMLHANENFLNALDNSLDEIKGQNHRMFCESDYHSSLDYSGIQDALGKTQTR